MTVRSGIERRQRMESLRGWFELQLFLAERLVAAGACDLFDAVTFHTNLHRRFGFGRPAIWDAYRQSERRHEGDAPAPEWEAFVERLERMPAHSERLDATVNMAVGHLVEFSDALSGETFGCFSFDPPDRAGQVKIHFVPTHDAEPGPLAASRMAERRQELETMFGAIAARHPEAGRVCGASWLYHLEAYRRLFPPAYVNTRKIERSPGMRFAGGSSWGQFLDHRGRLKPVETRAFLDNLEQLDPAALWRIFPLPMMVAEAPIGVFYESFGIHPTGAS